MNTTIKCIAFDADNTLYQTSDAAKSADMAAMDVLRKTTGIPALDLYREFLGIVGQIRMNPNPKVRHRLYSYDLLAKRHGTELTDNVYAAFSKKLLKEIKPIPGIFDLLPNLAKNFELWVITEDNLKMTSKKLSTLKIDKYFKGIISSDDTGTMKPSPKYYDNLLKKFKPEEIMVVGDNAEKDLALPASLGMRTLLIENPDDLEKILG